MNKDELFQSARRDLDSAKTALDVKDFNNALVMLGKAYSDVRSLIDYAWLMERETKAFDNLTEETPR